MHRWHFFRAGGVDQVSVRDASDLRSLAELDQKLWVALAMPVKGTDIDPETLGLMDLDNDGRIRVHDVLEAVKWVDATFVRADDVLQRADQVELSALKDPKVVAAARRMLSDLGKKDAPSINIEDTTAITKAFSDTVINGDGIVIPTSTEDLEVRKVIEDVIAQAGSVVDRSGKPGVTQAEVDKFFTAVDERVAWLARGKDSARAPLGDATTAAANAFVAVRAKLEDYFTRCRVAAFDPRGAVALGNQEEELLKLSQRTLSALDEELARLPLAKIDPKGVLPLASGINPAWAARMAAFVQDTLVPIVGAKERITAADVTQIVDRLAGFEEWREGQPRTIVDPLDAAWLVRLAEPEPRAKLKALIESDAALAAEYDQIASVAKAVRLQRDFGRLLRNFVNFSDFYRTKDGVFQAGTLYLDARAIRLCVPVADAGKHALLAAASDAYLIYCDITRKGETKSIAAALTNGDTDAIFVGRNGVFYDRDGNDWDATITKVMTSAISVRQAFWAPYKKLVKIIEENVQKRAAAAEAASTEKLVAVGTNVAHADKVAVVAAAAPPAPAAAPPAPAAAAAAPKKIDLGTVAAIGVAVGGIGTLFGALLANLFGLGVWLPFGIIAMLLLISGPSMALAWLKLRRRNLGPILDANGWAINGRARINVAFGAAMTELPRLPKGSLRTLDDPFADKKTPWKRWVFLVVLLVLAGTWYVGRLDRWLPTSVRSTSVLGKHAPAARAVEAPPPAPAP